MVCPPAVVRRFLRIHFPRTSRALARTRSRRGVDSLTASHENQRYREHQETCGNCQNVLAWSLPAACPFMAREVDLSSNFIATQRSIPDQ